MESMADAHDDSDDDQNDKKQPKTHYMFRNVFDLTAHSVLMTVQAGIENNCDESAIIRQALDAFKYHMDRINHKLNTATDH